MTKRILPVRKCKTCEKRKRIVCYGLCHSCFSKWRWKNKPEYRATSKKYVKKWREEHRDEYNAWMKEYRRKLVAKQK